jgi:chloramphenicol-sensitive protein RarD
MKNIGEAHPVLLPGASKERATVENWGTLPNFLAKWVMANKGILGAFGAYLIWGMVPVYWKLIQHVPATQLIGHRIIWSFLLLAAFLLVTRRWSELCSVAANGKVLRIYFVAAVLVGCNWFIYVWAVNSGHIVEASLGYFINPLFSVLLGVIFLRERLRFLQWLSVGLAATGVLYLTISYGRPPWIALGLTVTFGLYGLVKKKAPLGSINGLTLESGILFLPGLIFLFYQDWIGRGAFLHTGIHSDLLMAGAGLITTIPLVMFTYAAQRIPLTTIGLMHYITPTCQFFLGVLMYGEAFSNVRPPDLARQFRQFRENGMIPKKLAEAKAIRLRKEHATETITDISRRSDRD